MSIRFVTVPPPPPDVSKKNLKMYVGSQTTTTTTTTTGEKPCKCNHGHFSKSFTSSSERIKHNKCHYKELKPYNCTHDNCKKCNTDPSSLRKQLRALKLYSCGGSMDMSETTTDKNNLKLHSPALTDNNILAHMDHTLASQSVSMSSEKGGYQQEQHQPEQYSYLETVQPQPQPQPQHRHRQQQHQQVSDVYDDHQQQQHNNNHHHHYQQRQPTTYLHADYDPSREFANVLFSTSNSSEIARSMRDEPLTTANHEPNYYTNSSFDWPQRDQEAHLTNLDKVNNNHNVVVVAAAAAAAATDYAAPDQPQVIQYSNSLPVASILDPGQPVTRFRSQESLSASESNVVQGNTSSNDSDDVFKVCEWRDCGNTFLDINEFVRHLEEKHVNLEPQEKNRYFCLWHNCKRNKQEFNARYKLLIHMRVHSGEKPYSCQSASCKKSFSRLENLKIHVRSHTGEKPYKCNYDHCSKSFTNSSDRIKHHKTHKDPKPYNCTHDGCKKRYTDPSSLRKHLRAHKRHSFGSSMNMSESTDSNLKLNSTALNGSTSSHMDHKLASQSASMASEKGHSYHQEQHQPEQYSYLETVQPQPQQQQQQQHRQQQVSNAYDDHQQQQHNNNHHHHIHHHNHHQQRQPTNYLHTEYNLPTEFLDIPGSTRTISDISRSMRDEPITTDSHEPNYYTDSSFEWPQRDQEATHLTNLDQNTNSHNVEYGTHGQSQVIQYSNPKPVPSNLHQRQPVTRFQSHAEFHERQHQQLSKSWCGSNNASRLVRPNGDRLDDIWSDELIVAGAPVQRQFDQPRLAESLSTRTRRRVEFEFAPNTQDYEIDNWTSSAHHQQTDGVHYSARYGAQQPPDRAHHNQHHQQQQQQQQYEQEWSAQDHARLVRAPPADNNQQRRVQHQTTGQQQHHQNQLTRRQQHAQLMRSMPANVSFFQS